MVERQLWLWLTRGDDEARTAVCRVEEGGAVGTVVHSWWAVCWWAAAAMRWTDVWEI